MMKIRQHLIDLLRISVPMVIGNLGYVLIGVTDVYVAAKHSVNALASIALANSFLYTVLILGVGLLNGVSILLSNKRGEKEPTKKYLFSSIIFSQILAFLTLLAILAVTAIIPYCSFSPDIVADIQLYMVITGFSIFGHFLYQAVKEFLQAHEIVTFPNVILIVAVVLNLIFNAVFVFGFWIIPAMGVAGLAVATLLVRTFLGLIMLFYVRKILVKQSKNRTYNFDYMKKVMKIGFPIGIGLVFECLGFNIITVALGRDSSLLAATHNILATIVEATFMIPLAVSFAIAIKTGFYNGAKDLEEVKNYGKAGVVICTVFMMCCSVMFLLNPKLCINFFTDDVMITELALPVVTLFAIFELADGLQISLGGILKGLKLTKEVTLCSLGSYWLVGLPFGFFAAYKLGMSLMGFWTGLTVALFLVAILEFIIIQLSLKRLKKEY